MTTSVVITMARNESRPRKPWKSLSSHNRAASVRPLLLSLWLFCALIDSAAANGSVLWVATSGSDGNPGTAGAPFATIQGGVKAALPGDTILVKDGVYGAPSNCKHPNNGDAAVNINTAGSAKLPITLEAEHPWRAILDAGGRCHSYFNFGPQSAYWIVDGFDIRNGYWAGIWSNQGGGKQITVRGNHIHHIGNHYEDRVVAGSAAGEAGIFTDQAAVFRIQGNVINDVGRTNVFSNALDHAIYSYGTIDIVDNTFFNARSGWHIAVAYSFSGTIEHNAFYGPNLYLGDAKTGQISLWNMRGSTVVIRNNIFDGSNGDPVNEGPVPQPPDASVIVESNSTYPMDPGRNEAFRSTDGPTHLRAGAPELLEDMNMAALRANIAEASLLQMFLFQQRYAINGPDGNVPPGIIAGLTHFQTGNQLTPTGFLDSDTRVAIDKMLLESTSVMDAVQAE